MLGSESLLRKQPIDYAVELFLKRTTIFNTGSSWNGRVGMPEPNPSGACYDHEPVILEKVLVEHWEIIWGTCRYIFHAIDSFALVFPNDYTSATRNRNRRRHTYHCNTALAFPHGLFGD